MTGLRSCGGGHCLVSSVEERTERLQQARQRWEALQQQHRLEVEERRVIARDMARDMGELPEGAHRWEYQCADGAWMHADLRHPERRIHGLPVESAEDRDEWRERMAADVLGLDLDQLAETAAEDDGPRRALALVLLAAVRADLEIMEMLPTLRWAGEVL